MKTSKMYKIYQIVNVYVCVCVCVCVWVCVCVCVCVRMQLTHSTHFMTCSYYAVHRFMAGGQNDVCLSSPVQLHFTATIYPETPLHTSLRSIPFLEQSTVLRSVLYIFSIDFTSWLMGRDPINVVNTEHVGNVQQKAGWL